MAFPPKQTKGGSGMSYPEQTYHTTQGGAPAGPTFGSDLPVKSSSGKNATLNGYTANSKQDPLPHNSGH